jgi:hypothetical protein
MYWQPGIIPVSDGAAVGACSCGNCNHDQTHHQSRRSVPVPAASTPRSRLEPTAPVEIRIELGISPGSLRDAMAPACTCRRSSHSKRTTSHDHNKHPATQCPSDPTRGRNAPLYNRAGCSAEEWLRKGIAGRRHLSHHQYAPAEGRLTTVPHPQRRRTS